MNLSKLRIGTGFDVHAFCEGRPLWLGGVNIPHTKGLEGHSDADALIHAVVDAILGALCEGDIGQHFPPSDPQWKDASSSDFLKFVAGRVSSRGAEIISIDCTLILEEPKMRPYYAQIRQKMADLLGLTTDRVHVKATTTEQLGFTGRKEGIAAQAVCLLSLEKTK